MAKKEAAPAAQDVALEKVPTNTAVVVADDYGDDAGAGFENQGAADRVVPFLNVLQGLSPQCKREPYRPGMLYNTATEQWWSGSTGLLFVPCLTKRSFLEYAPRDAGGGFKGKHLPESDVVRRAIKACEDRNGEFGDWWTGEPKRSHELTEVFEVFGVVCDPNEEPQPVILPFAGMKIRRYKAWMSKLAAIMVPRKVPVTQTHPNGVQKVAAPLFAFLCRIKTQEEKNAKGEYYNLAITPENGDWQNLKDPSKHSMLPRTDERYQAARAFRDLVNAGAVKINYDAAQEERDGGGGGPKSEEDIPF